MFNVLVELTSVSGSSLDAGKPLASRTPSGSGPTLCLKNYPLISFRFATYFLNYEKQ